MVNLLHDEASVLGLRLGIAYEKKINSHFIIKLAYERNIGYIVDLILVV